MNIFRKIIHAYQSDFHFSLYWKARLYIQKNNGFLGIMLMMWVRHVEAKKCACTGTGKIGNCCLIKEPICLPHGLSGIIIGRNVKIGVGVTIFQHVTIAESDKNKITIISDNVVIGAGAVILNNPTIGKGAKIGANAVVVSDVPAGATAVGIPAKIISK